MMCNCLSFIKKHIRSTTKFHSSRHEGSFVGSSPQTKHQAPPNWNNKHYKSGDFVKILDVKPVCTKRPLLKIFWWRFCKVQWKTGKS